MVLTMSAGWHMWPCNSQLEGLGTKQCHPRRTLPPPAPALVASRISSHAASSVATVPTSAAPKTKQVAYLSPPPLEPGEGLGLVLPLAALAKDIRPSHWLPSRTLGLDDSGCLGAGATMPIFVGSQRGPRIT